MVHQALQRPQVALERGPSLVREAVSRTGRAVGARGGRRLVGEHVAQVPDEPVDPRRGAVLRRDLLVGERRAVVEAKVPELREVLGPDVVVEELVELQGPALLGAGVIKSTAGGANGDTVELSEA